MGTFLSHEDFLAAFERIEKGEDGGWPDQASCMCRENPFHVSSHCSGGL